MAVANPHNIQLIAKTRIKHDKVDARVLGELLRTNFFPRSYIPDAETREKRLLVKDRVKYGVRRADLKNTVKWLLKRRGIKVKSPFSKVGRESLRSLGLKEVEIRLRELELVDTIIEELDRRIHFAALGDHEARLLDTIPGAGPLHGPLPSHGPPRGGTVQELQARLRTRRPRPVAPPVRRQGDTGPHNEAG